MKKTDLTKWYTNLLSGHGSLIALLLLMLAASVIYPEFCTVRNLSNVLRQMSMVGLSAIGMTFVIISGGIDLSIGAVIGLTGVIAAQLSGTSVFLAVLLPVLTGLVIGFVNAFVERIYYTCFRGIVNGDFLFFLHFQPRPRSSVLR